MSGDDATEVALVTGGSTGIGRAVAERFAADGYAVVICARSEGPLTEAADEIDGEVLPVPTDISESDAVEELLATVDAEYGRLDVLVNNAGIVGSGATSFDDLTIDDWKHLFDINFFGAVRVTKQSLPLLRDGGKARIINMLSTTLVRPEADKPHYCAAKAALLNLTKALSRGYGEEGVLVNGVMPTITRTPLIEQIFEDIAEDRGISKAEAEDWYMETKRSALTLGRPGEPEEVANVVAFLASDEASYVTGSTYRVEGGSLQTMDV